MGCRMILGDENINYIKDAILYFTYFNSVKIYILIHEIQLLPSGNTV